MHRKTLLLAFLLKEKKTKASEIMRKNDESLQIIMAGSNVASFPA
jgi:hypothetical protein